MGSSLFWLFHGISTLSPRRSDLEAAELFSCSGSVMEEPLRAIRAIAESVRMSYGPLGLDQLVVSEGQKLVTNSASRIWNMPLCASPMAQLILGHVQAVSTSLGDGAATLVLLLEGALAACAEALDDRAGSRTTATRAELARCFGYIEAEILPSHAGLLLEVLSAGAEAPATAVEAIGAAPVPAEGMLHGLARGLFGANFPPEVSEQLSRVFCRWLRENAAARGDDAEDHAALAAAAAALQRDDLVHIHAKPLAGSHASAGGPQGPHSSTVEHCHILSGVLGHPSMPEAIENEFRAVMLDETTAPYSLRVSSPSRTHAYLTDLLALVVQQFWQAGVRCALCEAEVHDEWRGALAQRGILLLQLVEGQDLALLERGRNVSRVRLASHTTEAIRRSSFALGSMRPLGPRPADGLAAGRAAWAIVPSASEPMTHCWLVLRAPSVGLAREYKHALLRLLRVAEPALRDPSATVFAGLAFDLSLARLAQQHASWPSEPHAAPERGPAPSGTAAGVPCRLRQLAWRLLLAGELRVLEAFLSGLLPRPAAAARLPLGAPAGDSVPASAKRLARWLVVAPACELDSPRAREELKLRRVHPRGTGACPPAGAAHFGFALLAGTGAGEPAPGGALETAHLRLGLLRAACALCRQLARLEPVGTAAARGLRLPSHGRRPRAEPEHSDSSSDG
ncbi:unnamed protein product [Prorocentrum cordatum]|uniref:E3 ubiquitin-protein ligase n=1 Tax=Prorocentrum cordatum TaxID=2364126 RepID=A0ABN9VTX6_9DINO|nr:unnamed protein product [Polarella glacialis]